jgi:hypothetical protein
VKTWFQSSLSNATLYRYNLYHYDDYDHRDAVRAAMGRDSKWKDFLASTKSALVSQKSEMFLPVGLYTLNPVDP